MIDVTVPDSADAELDLRMMQRAAQLAWNGEYTTSPNPAVGAVIAVGPRIIGEGWHRKFGEAHAEVNAVNSVADKSLLPQATAYVTLEPCSHYGKTPPCAELLVRCGVRRVVVGCMDPNPAVSGRGIAMLRNAGIDVTVGVAEDLCRRPMRRFLFAQENSRPYVTLKWACSADGFMDHVRVSADDAPARFSTPLTTLGVMRLRAVSDAIMVGSATVIADNPSLTVRGIEGRSSARVVLDRRGRVPAAAKVFEPSTCPEVVYVTSGLTRSDLPAHVKQIVVDPAMDMTGLLRLLRKQFGWISLLVEGGPTLLRSFLSEGVWEECRIETAPFTLGKQGCAQAPARPFGAVSTVVADGNSIAIIERQL